MKPAILLLLLTIPATASTAGWPTAFGPGYNGTGYNGTGYNGTGNWMLPAPPVTAMRPVYLGSNSRVLPAPPVTAYVPVYRYHGHRAARAVALYHADRKRRARAERTRLRLQRTDRSN